jgi:hypothetical protein
LLWLHETLRAAAAAHGCHFLDLDGVFEEDYRANGVKFNTSHDYHWDANGHTVAAAGLLDFLRDRGVVGAPESP